MSFEGRMYLARERIKEQTANAGRSDAAEPTWSSEMAGSPKANEIDLSTVYLMDEEQILAKVREYILYESKRRDSRGTG